MSASLDALSGLATAGIGAAKVAVLVVLGAGVSYAAAMWGTIRVLKLFGVDVKGGADAGMAAPESTSSMLDAEYLDEKKHDDWERAIDDSWGEGWSDASGTRDADIARWRN